MPEQPGKDNRHPTTKAKVPAFVFTEGRRDCPAARSIMVLPHMVKTINMRL